VSFDPLAGAAARGAPALKPPRIPHRSPAHRGPCFPPPHINPGSFMRMAADYKKKIGFKATLLLEPKPQEPTKHQ
jgi:hypothetical protein